MSLTRCQGFLNPFRIHNWQQEELVYFENFRLLFLDSRSIIFICMQGCTILQNRAAHYYRHEERLLYIVCAGAEMHLIYFQHALHDEWCNEVVISFNTNDHNILDTGYLNRKIATHTLGIMIRVISVSKHCFPITVSWDVAVKRIVKILQHM